MSDPNRSKTNSEARYEQHDINVRGVIRFIFGLVIAALLIYFAVTWVFDNLNGRPTISQKNVNVFRADSLLPPEPRLQPMPGHPEHAASEMQSLSQSEDSILRNFSWIDSANGIIRIPITTAKEIIVKRGSSMEGKP